MSKAQVISEENEKIVLRISGRYTDTRNITFSYSKQTKQKINETENNENLYIMTIAQRKQYKDDHWIFTKKQTLKELMLKFNKNYIPIEENNIEIYENKQTKEKLLFTEFVEKELPAIARHLHKKCDKIIICQETNYFI